MQEAVALIDQLIEEHKVIGQRIGKLESVVNDAEALGGVDQAKEAFMPGRPQQAKGLKDFQQLLKVTCDGLEAHFKREETALLGIVQKYSSKESAAALNSLLLEHTDLRGRLDNTVKDVQKLVSGGLSRHVWEASAHDLRAHISHTRKLIEAHAGIEQELFHKLRNELFEK